MRTSDKLSERNEKIRNDYISGIGVNELVNKYHLSMTRIYTIISQYIVSAKSTRAEILKFERVIETVHLLLRWRKIIICLGLVYMPYLLGTNLTAAKNQEAAMQRNRRRRGRNRIND